MVTDKGLKFHQFVLVAGARFCHYFTPPIRIALIPEEGKFSNENKSFLKLQLKEHRVEVQKSYRALE